MEDQIILIDKPAGISSFGAVARVRKELRDQFGHKVKVGHTGTLDPFATGLLILLSGKNTKKSSEFLKLDKVYEATLKLGYTSTTGDPEGEITPYISGKQAIQANMPSGYSGACWRGLAREPREDGRAREAGRSPRRDPEGKLAELPIQNLGQIEAVADYSEPSWTSLNSGRPQLTSEEERATPVTTGGGDASPSLDEVKTVLLSFIGEISQTVPRFSAVKINGQRAYKLARAGKDFETPTRNVTIYNIELLSYHYPDLKIRCHVSSGTYIRTLAEDIGQKLGTGAYLTALRRTKIGDFDVQNAQKLL